MKIGYFLSGEECGPGQDGFFEAYRDRVPPGLR